MIKEIQTATADLWQLKLDKAVGGSGVSAVDIIIVDLKTRDGLEGRGFSYVLGSSGQTATYAAREIIKNFLIKKTLTHPESLAREIRQSFNRTGRGPNAIAHAAIDTAAWDLYGKSLNCPVGIAMGGSEREVPVYGSGGFNATQSPDEAVEQALSYIDLGVKAVKPRVSGKRKDEKIIEAVRSAIGDNADLMLDANEKCNQASAIRLLEIAHSHNALFVEEPLPALSTEGYRQISAKSTCAIAVGEHLQGITESSPFLMNGICNIIQPDLAMMGGLTESLRLARYAEMLDISVAPHFLPNVFIHLAIAMPNVIWLEDFPLLEPIFGNPETFDSSGMLVLNGLPGLGLNWDEDAEKRYKVDF
jgi:L-alanine-DL-glutamate epimerase-like enolase superfamily enzyme